MAQHVAHHALMFMHELMLTTAESAQAHAMFPVATADKSCAGPIYMKHTDTTAVTYTVTKPMTMPLLQVLADASTPSHPEAVWSHSAGPLVFSC